VISPFQIAKQQKNSEVLQFPLWDRNLFKEGSACHGLDVSLSTAVSLSARFPWLTPAGSLTTDCRETGAPPESRLVDGGYFDNSGVDTALDVIGQIKSGLAGQSDPSKHQLGIEIHLIILNTGGFPERVGYGLGDVLEPIRALLSTRVARTPIAINRARQQLEVSEPVGGIPHVHQASFHDPIYTLPLGWRISEPSRDIIERQSGRFWECNPDLTYNQQGDQDFSNADCIQLMIYHQLNETLDEELKQLEIGADWIKGHKLLEQPYPRLSHKDFERCYLEKLFGNVIAIWRAARSAGRSGAKLSIAQWAALPQGNERGTRDAIEPILTLWDANPQNPDEWLAYMLTIYDYDTGGVARRELGCLSDKCALHLHPGAGHWDPRYYERGFIKEGAGPDIYQKVAKLTGIPVYENPDLMLLPEVSARVFFAWMTDPELSLEGGLAKYTGDRGFDFEAALTEHFRREFPDPSRDILKEGGYPRTRTARDYQLFMDCIKVAKMRKPNTR
jgi:hypothetical protein